MIPHRVSSPDELVDVETSAVGSCDLERGYALLMEQPARARALAQDVERLGRSQGDLALVGRALALETRVAIRCGKLEAALEALVESESLLARSATPELAAEVAVASTRLTFYSGGYREALERIQQAVAIADEHSLDRVRLDARFHLSLILGSLELPECLEVARETVVLAQTLGCPYEEAMGRNDVAFTLFTRGDLENAAAEVEPAITIAAALQDDGRHVLAYALSTRADIRLAAGAALDALADADEVLRLIETGGDPDPYLTGFSYGVRMRCLSALGRTPDAVEAGHLGLAVTGEAVPFVRGMLLRDLATALRCSGCAEEAYDALEEGFHLERAVLEQQATRQLAIQRAALEMTAARREAIALSARNAELHATKAELERRVQQVERLRDRFREQSEQDWLTGLRNRRWLAHALPPLLSDAQRESFPVSFVTVDIDHFKAVNDRFGHDAGDRVLQAFATALVAAVSRADIVVRLGGEEFAIVMPATPKAGAVICCERIHALLRDQVWPVRDPNVALTVSAGVASSDEQGGARELAALADERLYTAKTTGRNRTAA
jgi:diguanylate cyclase (GGDEF)-like protein